MTDPLSTALARGVETERDLKIGGRLTREDKRSFALEKTAGDRNEALAQQQGILDFTRPANSSVKVVDGDEWPEWALEKKKPSVGCPCGNRVENEADIFCEICISKIGRAHV